MKEQTKWESYEDAKRRIEKAEKAKKGDVKKTTTKDTNTKKTD